MKTYSNTLFFAENSEKERIDHFDIRSVFQIKVFIWIDNPIPAPTWSWAFLGGWSLCQVLQTTFETKRLVFDQHKFIKKFTTTQLTEKTLRFNLDYKATTRVESLPSSMRRSELVPQNFSHLYQNSVQEPDLWRRVCKRAGAVLGWVWTNSHCCLHYLWHECHHDLWKGAAQSWMFKIKILRLYPNPSPKSKLGGSCPLQWTAFLASASAERARSTWMRATGSSMRALRAR